MTLTNGMEVHEMTTPGFTAEASLFKTSERYQLTAAWAAGSQRVAPQQDFVPPLPGGPIIRCSPCMYGRQICCPPLGFGLRCFIRLCGIVPL